MSKMFHVIAKTEIKVTDGDDGHIVVALGPDSTDTIIAALAAAGYAIVPLEPTREMLLSNASDHWPYSPSGFYRAMVTAAKETK